MHVDEEGYLTVIQGFKQNSSIQTARIPTSLCRPLKHIVLSIAGKILNCLNVHLDQTGLIPECQCVFREYRITIYTIFTSRHLQEICQ